MQELPFAHGGPRLTGTLRSSPEDFVVDEQLGYGADGDGEHVLLQIRKRGENTDWVARELARFAGVPPLNVGYAGLKDRHAVTTQTFSVQLPGQEEPDWAAFPHESVKVLSSQRHRRKIKKGALAGNRFTLILREVQGDRDGAEQQLEAIRRRGVPNYFGEQRFGFGGHNVERAEAMFAGKRVDKNTRSMLLSAARSQIFNAVLAQRVEASTWDRGIDGEIWSLAGSRSWFGPEALTDDLAIRLASCDIHPSGPLWGRGALPSAAEAETLERSVSETYATLATGLEKAGLEQARRSLRLLPRDFVWEWLPESALKLTFELPAGAYATVVVRELVLATA